MGGQSSKDFTVLASAAKVAREAGYWLRLIGKTQPRNHPVLAECGELVTMMLNSIIVTTRSKLAAAVSRVQFRTQNTEP